MDVGWTMGGRSWTLGGRWVDAHGRWVDDGWTLMDDGWTMGGRWMDDGWTLDGHSKLLQILPSNFELLYFKRLLARDVVLGSIKASKNFGLTRLLRFLSLFVRS